MAIAITILQKLASFSKPDTSFVNVRAFTSFGLPVINTDRIGILDHCGTFLHHSEEYLSVASRQIRDSKRAAIPTNDHLCQSFQKFHDSESQQQQQQQQNNNPSNQKESAIHHYSVINSNEKISNLLICGDGDLSFSASISQELSEHTIQLTATVLEDQTVHQDVYARSNSNQNIILNAGQEIRFGIDATNLSQHFQEGVDTFDRIQFNFPHWKGKANHRYNRELLNDFLKSASQFLSPSGEIHVALCEGQGGSTAKTLQDWRGSWTPSLFAAEQGLLLLRTTPFEPVYNLSSHRGKDRGFKIGKPKMYIFGKSNGPSTKIDIAHQLCSRHELHIVLPSESPTTVVKMDEEDRLVSVSKPPLHINQPLSPTMMHRGTLLDGIVNGDTVKEIIQDIVPEGIRVEVPDRAILHEEDDDCSTIVIYLIVYCGEYRVLRRSEADNFRRDVEKEMEKYVPLREDRRGRLVSRVFPYFLLDSLIRYGTSQTSP